MAVNPLTGQEVPVFIGDYVREDVGESAIMGVPSHCEADAKFKNQLPLKSHFNFSFQSYPILNQSEIKELFEIYKKQN